MTRWSTNIGKIISLSEGKTEHDKFLNMFYQPKNYIPTDEQEKKEFDDFSLVTSSMAILVHIAKADNVIKAEEREQIVSSLIFQLNQRLYEYSELSEKFGDYEKEIINNMFDTLLAEYEKGTLDLDKIIDVICMVYQNNLEKKLYLIRLCYYCALSDFDFDKSEKEAIQAIAARLKISKEELKRIEQEAKEDMIYRMNK